MELQPHAAPVIDIDLLPSPALPITLTASSVEVTMCDAAKTPSSITEKPAQYSSRVQRISRVNPTQSQAHPFYTSDMRPSPAKRQRIHNYDRRPRLSICPSVSPDAELVEDRDRNDNTLKGKFEAIFEKYGRDFSDIGDEINVITGEVIVDNGHILSMQDEKDPGSPSRARPQVSRESTEVHSVGLVHGSGRSLTVGAEDVIARIEAMARRVVTGQTPYPEEDEQENEDVYGSGAEEIVLYHRRSGSMSSDSLLGIGANDYQDEWGSQRSGSPDSLIEPEDQDSSIESFHEEHAILPPIPIRKLGSMGEPMTLTSESSSVSVPVIVSASAKAPATAQAGVSETITITQGAPSEPASDPEVLAARPGGSHSHPFSASFHPSSPPAFVKSNGKQKVVAKKFNVSKAYEDLQRQASSTPAAKSWQQAPESKTRTSRNLALDKPSSKKAKPASTSHQGPPKPEPMRESKAVLKRLPVARPSSEPLTLEGDYESDDPLQ